MVAPVASLSERREKKASELPSFWPPESHENRAKFGGDSHLYPFFGVESGVRTRSGIGRLIWVGGGIARVVLDNERELVKDAPKSQPAYVARDFPARDVFPAYVDTNTINEYRRWRREATA